MNDIQIFSSPTFGEIRTQMSASGEPLFCATDVCTALGYVNSRKAIADHVDEWDVTKRNTLTSGGAQQLTYINESGLYSLIVSMKGGAL